MEDKHMTWKELAEWVDDEYLEYDVLKTIRKEYELKDIDCHYYLKLAYKDAIRFGLNDEQFCKLFDNFQEAFSNEYWYGVDREEKTILYSNGDGGIDLYDSKAFKFTDVKILENKSAIYFQYKVNGETKHIEISFAVLQKLLEGDNGRGF